MNPPTDAELDLALRQNDVNARRMRHAVESFSKARNHLHQQKIALAGAVKAMKKQDAERVAKLWTEAEEHALRARAVFARGYGWLLNPDLPGVEAEDLGMREAGSKSVMCARGVHLAGHLDREGREAQKELRAATGDVTLAKVFGELTRRVNPLEVLEGMAESGWDSKRIGRLCAGMLASAETATSLSVKQSAMRTVLELWKFTEPKAVIDVDRPLDEMSEQETQEVMKVLAKDLGLLQ